MYRRVMAFDFDGTLAKDGMVPPELVRALKRCRAGGHALFLVTGRRFETLSLEPLGDLFSGIVWENGAVLVHLTTGEIFLPFGQVPGHILKHLEEAEIPFERGLAIAATWVPHDQRVWQILSEQKGGASVEYNKGNVMVLPPGASKGPGLERLLTLCGYSVHNLAAFGDAENDLSMFHLAEVSVAVGDALPSVQARADVVAERPGPAGVLEILNRYPLAKQFLDIPLQRERPISLGQDETGQDVTIPASRLAGRNMGVFGDSGTGKSWLVGLLAEGLHHQEYQVLLLDPEGDFRGLRALPRFVALSGDEGSLPAPFAVVALLEESGVSAVLDLSGYPLSKRTRYLADLVRTLRPLRERKYRPHWIVLEESQQFLHPSGTEVTGALLPLLEAGGWAFVSYRPDRLEPKVLGFLHHCLLTQLTEPEAVRAVREQCQECHLRDMNLEDVPQGSVILGSGRMARLRPAIRRFPHIRHLFKYLDSPLPPWKRFWFRNGRGGVGAEAASLYEFLQLIPTLPIESLEWHDRRQDFSRWVEEALGDTGLAARLRKVSNRKLEGEELREALRQTVAAHYEELNALR